MTESRPERAPAGISLDQPSPARVWDYFLRGSHDFDRPVAILLCSLLRFVSDEDDPRAVVATLRDAMAPGSHLIVQHASHDGQSGGISKMLQMWNTNSPEPMYWRTRDEIESLFEGFVIVEPGVVQLPLWRPDAGDRERAAQNPERYASYAAVGTKSPVTTG